jgi:dephospho-CoA kinase
MLIVGLTGGICSGKTTVSDAFARLGVPVIDTDILARELVARGQPALTAIVEQFGPEYLDESGNLNRNQLRKRIFADPIARQHLEAILHPRIRSELRRRLAALKATYCIVVVPLLLETGMADMVHRILVVDIPETLQLSRVISRDSVDETQARCILAAQVKRNKRLARADDIIDNSGGLTDLDHQITNLHHQYQALATEHRPQQSGDEPRVS